MRLAVTPVTGCCKGANGPRCPARRCSPQDKHEDSALSVMIIGGLLPGRSHATEQSPLTCGNDIIVTFDKPYPQGLSLRAGAFGGATRLRGYVTVS